MVIRSCQQSSSVIVVGTNRTNSLRQTKIWSVCHASAYWGPEFRVSVPAVPGILHFSTRGYAKVTNFGKYVLRGGKVQFNVHVCPIVTRTPNVVIHCDIIHMVFMMCISHFCSLYIRDTKLACVIKTLGHDDHLTTYCVTPFTALDNSDYAVH